MAWSLVRCELSCIVDYQVAGNARAGAELTRDADIIEFPYVSDEKKRKTMSCGEGSDVL